MKEKLLPSNHKAALFIKAALFFVKSYLQIAEAIGNPKSVRAVGQANRANQVPIIIPCHRVIGKNGDLVGFAGDKTNV